MSIRNRIFTLTAALILVETASYWKLSHWLGWTNEAWLAYLTAVAFVGLLLASIVALGSNIPAGMRTPLYVAGITLFAVQGLANVLMAYDYGETVLPVRTVTGFFGVGTEFALKSMAVIQGATLSTVSACFWSILGFLLRQLGDVRQQQRAQIKDLERILNKVSP